jgi:hypothetical protein
LAAIALDMFAVLLRATMFFPIFASKEECRPCRTRLMRALPIG